jgi:hypothetical protein
MNKKLLCSTALVGALMVSGSAFAELKIGGNVTNTVTFGTDDSGANLTDGLQSGERIGTEMNLTLKSKKDLNNGMYIQYAGTIEYDDSSNDVEYEIQLGNANFYVGLGSDAGNNISSSPTLPAVGYHVGTLSQMTSASQPVNNDGLALVGFSSSTSGSRPANQEANDPAHISLNAKVLGGLASVVYAPNSNTGTADDDADDIIGSTGASITSYLYQGKPVANTKFIIGRNVLSQETDGDDAEVTTDKIGVSYNFGKIRAGYEYQKATYEDENVADDFVLKAHNYAVTFAASDNVTLGVQHSRSTTNDEVEDLTEREKLTALSVGYNLGGASIAVSLVETENLQGIEGFDTQGLVITTRMGF